MAKLTKPKSVLRKGIPPQEEEASNNLAVVEAQKTVENQETATEKTPKEETRPLNFKVPNSFRKRFKNYATNNDVTMSELLISCFEEYEKSRKQ